MNHYHTLGLTETATRREVKRAYRQLARALHPDRNASPEAAARYREVVAAYEAITQDWTKQDSKAHASSTQVQLYRGGRRHAQAVRAYQGNMPGAGAPASRVTVWC